MRYQYFVDFRHGLSVFASFSCGIEVLGTPQKSLSFREELKSRDLQVLIRKPKCTCQFKGESVNHLFYKVILIINSFK